MPGSRKAAQNDIVMLWYEEICGDLAERSTDRLWTELADLESFRGGSQRENLRLAMLVDELATRDDDGDLDAMGARKAFETWKTGPPDGSDSGHIVPWMLKVVSNDH